MKKLLMVAAGTVFLIVSGGVASAQTPTMYTLGEIYYYLVEGTEATEGGHTLGPPSGSIPGDTRFRTLQAIYQNTKALFDQCDALPSDVAAGKTFFSFQTSSWGLQTGADTPPELLVTGQTTSYRDYDDGWYEKGAAYDYTDNGDGTVTDNVTSLMWAQDGTGAGCMNGAVGSWSTALDWAESLTFAGYSDWRMPNIRELGSITVFDAALSVLIKEPPFTNTVSNLFDFYWSSTVNADSTTFVWTQEFSTFGQTITKAMTTTYYLRVVR